MTDWKQPFTGRLQTRTAHEPRVLFLLCDAVAANKFSISAAITDINVDIDEDFGTNIGQDIIVYDDDHFELCEIAQAVDGGASTTLSVVARGAYDTPANAFGTDANIARILAAYSTGTISSAGGFSYADGVCSMPSGSNVSIDRHTGRTTADDVAIQVQDVDQQITKALKASPMIGNHCIFLVGYADQPLHDYVFAWVGRVASVDIISGVVYEFRVESVINRMSQKLYDHLEDYADTLNGAINSSTTTVTVDDGAALPATIDKDMGGGYAGYTLLIGTEKMRVDIHSGTSTTVTVVRGWLGTTAASHGDEAAIDLLFAVEDNVIDMLVSFLATRSAELPSPGTRDWDTVGDDAFGALGVGLLPGDIDYDSFDAIRDRWFQGYIGRVEFDRGENLKPWIEQHILKPLNLNLYPTRTGKIALAYIAPPLDTPTRSITEDDIAGVPDIYFDNQEILNDVTVNYDWDPIDRDFASKVRVIDEESVVDYNITGQMDMDAKLIHSDNGGATKAPRLARKKRRNLRDPNPTIPVLLPFNFADVNIGDIVSVTHSGIPDVRAGVVGWSGKLCAVTGRRIDWTTGAVRLDLVDTVYFGKRYGLISPSGTVDYSSADAETISKYCFISDANDLMSDGTTGYQIA